MLQGKGVRNRVLSCVGCGGDEPSECSLCWSFVLKKNKRIDSRKSEEKSKNNN